MATVGLGHSLERLLTPAASRGLTEERAVTSPLTAIARTQRSAVVFAILALASTTALATESDLSGVVLTQNLPPGYTVKTSLPRTLAQSIKGDIPALAAHKRATWVDGWRSDATKPGGADLASTAARYKTPADAAKAVALGIASGKAAGAKVVGRPTLGKGAVVLRIRKTVSGTTAESVVVGWRRGPLVLSVQAIGAPGLNVDALVVLARRQDVLARGAA